MIVKLDTLRARLPRPKWSALSGAADRLVQGWQPAETGTLSLLLPRDWPRIEGTIRWWWRPTHDRNQHGEVTRLEELPPEVRAGAVIAWTPAGDTLFASATLPTRTRARIMQALPFALEEQLVADPETQHFAYCARDDGSLAVAITARTRLEEWLGAFRAAGLRLAAICPATLAVPWTGSGWVLAADGGDGFVRTGPYAGFACPRPWDHPPAVLAVALREAHQRGDAPAELVVWNPPPEFDRDAWITALGLTVVVPDASPWETLPAEPPFNLLQGDLAPVGELRQMLAPLRPAAIVLGVGFAVSLVLSLVEWGGLSYTESRQRAEMTAIFAAAFPDVKTIVDPALQMERNLGALQAASGRFTATDLLAMISKFADILRDYHQTKVRGMQYAEAGVTLDLLFPDFQQMEIVKNAFRNRGFRVEVLSANSRSGGVEGRIRLKLERRS